MSSSIDITKIKSYKDFNGIFQVMNTSGIELEDGEMIYFKDQKTYKDWRGMMKKTDMTTTSNFTPDGEVVSDGTFCMDMETRDVTYKDCRRFTDFKKFFPWTISYESDIIKAFTGEYEYLRKYVEVKE